ncbi:hypothetical protein G9A89_016217 [Geosiphon pyriformis]|nr:hypothetical protein G9A89_016217 [Geosiphon pyriformis]
MCHANENLCKIPGCEKPIYVDQYGNQHPFCSFTCAQRRNRSKPISRVNRSTSPPLYLSTLEDSQICKIHGCNLPVYVEPNGRKHEYCTRTCARKYMQQIQHQQQQQEQQQQEQQQRPQSPIETFVQPNKLLPLPAGYHYFIAPISDVSARNQGNLAPSFSPVANTLRISEQTRNEDISRPSLKSFTNKTFESFTHKNKANKSQANDVDRGYSPMSSPYSNATVQSRNSTPSSSTSSSPNITAAHCPNHSKQTFNKYKGSLEDFILVDDCL